MFLCLTSLLAQFFAIFSCFSVVSQSFCPFGILAYKNVVVLGAEMHWIASTLCKVCIHSRHALLERDFFELLILCLVNEKV